MPPKKKAMTEDKTSPLKATTVSDRVTKKTSGSHAGGTHTKPNRTTSPTKALDPDASAMEKPCSGPTAAGDTKTCAAEPTRNVLTALGNQLADRQLHKQPFATLSACFRLKISGNETTLGTVVMPVPPNDVLGFGPDAYGMVDCIMVITLPCGREMNVQGSSGAIIFGPPDPNRGNKAHVEGVFRGLEAL